MFPRLLLRRANLPHVTSQPRTVTSPFISHTFHTSPSPRSHSSHLLPQDVTTQSPNTESIITRRAQILEKVMEMKNGASMGGLKSDSLACSIYDSRGNLDPKTTKISKADLCEKYELHPRDLRKLDSTQILTPGDYKSRFTLEACILPRKKAILVNLLYVKALITHSHIILFNPPSSTNTPSMRSIVREPQIPEALPAQTPSSSSSSATSSSTSCPSTSKSSSSSTSADLSKKSEEETGRQIYGNESGKGQTIQGFNTNTDTNKQSGKTGDDLLYELFGKSLSDHLAGGYKTLHGNELGIQSNDGADQQESDQMVVEKGKECDGDGKVDREEAIVGRGEPFEHRALESLLLTLLSLLTSELTLFLSRIRCLLHDLSEEIDPGELKELLTLRGTVRVFGERVKGVNTGVERVLGDDEDLAAAYLTAKASHTPRSATDHEELELLLENYSQHLEGILSEISGALADVQSTQNVVELLLDSSRNMLLVLDLRLSVATLGMTTGALGAGLLGMNLTNTFEDSSTAFYVVTAALLTLSSGVVIIGWRALTKMSRVGLAGVKGFSVKKELSKQGQEVRKLITGGKKVH